MTVIVDTNVILVANRQHSDVSERCVVACARRLERIMRRERVALDDDYQILKEYQNKTAPRTGRGPGDVFVKWLLRNLANERRCVQVALTEHPERGFESFPDDTELASFDRADRKFVAVAALHPERPPIAQAADSKWLAWAPALKRHGVRVDFVCPADIRRFEREKNRSKGRSR